MILLDDTCMVRVANDAALDLLGCGRGDIEGQPGDEALRRLTMDAPGGDVVLAELAAIVRTAAAGRSGLVTIPSRSGSARPTLHVRAGPVAGAGAGSHGVCLVLEPRAQARALSLRASEAGEARHVGTLGLLAEALRADVAHLAGHVKRHDSDAAEWIGRVQADAGMLAQALQALEALERVQSDAGQGAGHCVDAGDVLMGALPLWKTRAPHHSFELALAGEAPAVAVGELWLAEAVNILLEAAARWTPLGGVIRVSVRRADAGTEVEIRPFAAGPFLGPREPAQAYAAFPNGLEMPESAVRGGLGLPLARAILLAHGGTLRVEQARAGEPLSFRLWLPERAPASQAVAPQDSGEASAAVETRMSVARPRATVVALPRNGRSAVVICDADHRMLRYLRANLEQQGHQPVVAPALTDVSRLVEVEEPAAVVLDVGGDEAALTEVLRRVCELTEAPVLLLAHRHDPDQSARLLDAGATDYIAKPFSIDELLARLRAATRTRTSADLDDGGRVVATGDLTIDLGRRIVSVAGADVRLSRTEFNLLKALAQHAGAVLSHDELLARVWGASYRQETDFVWVYMRRLRRKIEPDPAHPRYLLTTPGVGYRLAKLPTPLPA